MKKLVFIFYAMIFSTTYSQTRPSVVKEVDLKRYAGTWYEIARLPNTFEKGLKCITATYELREDGRITVINRGHKVSDPSKISTARGVAWLPDKNVTSKLKVQFFWPFSGDYWIIELDKDYRYVLVGDPSFKYLWILARDKKIDEATIKRLLDKAVENGFDIRPVIRVDHNC
ncbi:MAG TPA: lipocalin family protein [Bacteroidales bacterium]|nr:lipocalin family protein [Bacteroidales bacterium]